MSLLRDIQNDVINPNIDITVILRKCQVLAARLGNEDFKLWVDYELNGYPNNDTLPDYRILPVESYGNFVTIGWVHNNAQIPPSTVPKRYRELTTTQYFIEPISYYSSLVKGLSGSEMLKVDWPADLLAYLSKKIMKSWTCTKAWKQISASSIHALLDTVRNRILKFVIELDSEAPDIDETPPSERTITEERVGQVFQTIIMGNVEHLATGSQTITYSTQINVYQNDFESLKQYLASIGVTEKDIQELNEAITEDEKTSEERKLGDRVKRWLGKMISKAGSTSWNIATSVATQLLIRALTKYYGFEV